MVKLTFLDLHDMLYEGYHGFTGQNIDDTKKGQNIACSSNDPLFYPENIINNNRIPIMTLILCSPLKNGEMVFASESRSTIINSNGIVTFNDNEQKIFSIEDSPLILLLTGANRFSNGKTIQPLVQSLKNVDNLNVATEMSMDFLSSCSVNNSEPSKIILFDARESSKCSIVWNILGVEGSNSDRNVYIPLEKTHSFGSPWAVHLSRYLAPPSNSVEAEIIRLRSFMSAFCNLSTFLQKEEQTLGGEIQILVTYPNGVKKFQQ